MTLLLLVIDPIDISLKWVRAGYEPTVVYDPTTDSFNELDGMSTGTARFIIDREIGKDVLEKYDIKDLENKGLFYLAKIVNQDGRVTDTVLIDKLNRSIHFQKDKFR